MSKLFAPLLLAFSLLVSGTAVSLMIGSAGVFFTTASALKAQQNQNVWIQLAARDTLKGTEQEARDFASRLPDVSAYSIGGGWYGIVLGPYIRSDAEQVLRVYRAEQQIPLDSFITFSNNLRNRIYPVGTNTSPATIPPVAPLEAPQPDTTSSQLNLTPDETPTQARRSEQALTRPQREALQTALKSEGFYTSSIDGDFGRGTRRSMGDWQAANGFEPTGILTTAQRKILMDAYNTPLISVGMAPYTDTKAGIALDLPLGAVMFSRYEPPFVHFETTNDIPEARVFLISQPGDQRTLYGLYDIMQTLEIIPLEGPRSRKGNTFILEGRNAKIVSYTEARLIDGEIKGFTLVWPTGDDARRKRVLTAMQSSFTRKSGVLSPAEGGQQTQAIDFVSGLEIRRPLVTRSGFFVTPQGAVATSLDAVENCGRITLDSDYDAQVIYTDAGAGLALLKPDTTLAPVSYATLSQSNPQLRSSIAVSGFTYGGVLGAPSLTWGQVNDLHGLDGEEHLTRLNLEALEADSGGPVLDKQGTIQGMLLPPKSGTKTLPQGVRFALKADQIYTALTSSGLTDLATATAQPRDLPPAQLQRLADGMTTLVSCWE